MALKKCPRCELNYILDDGALCTVCREEVHGRVDREERTYVCSVCGVAAALPGEEMCRSCRNDILSVEMSATGAEDEKSSDTADLSVEPVSSLDEMDAMDEVDAKDDVEELDDEETDEELIREFAEAQ